MSLTDTSAASSMQANLQMAGAQAGRNFASGAGRSVFNKLGGLGEKGVEKIIRNCVGPPRRGNLNGTKVNLDFEVELAGKLLSVEAKYQTPKKAVRRCCDSFDKFRKRLHKVRKF